MLKSTQEEHISEVYSYLRQTSNMEFSPKPVKGFKLFIIFAKSSILDSLLSSEYTFESIREVTIISRYKTKKREQNYVLVFHSITVECRTLKMAMF